MFARTERERERGKESCYKVATILLDAKINQNRKSDPSMDGNKQKQCKVVVSISKENKRYWILYDFPLESFNQMERK